MASQITHGPGIVLQMDIPVTITIPNKIQGAALVRIPSLQISALKFSVSKFVGTPQQEAERLRMYTAQHSLFQSARTLSTLYQAWFSKDYEYAKGATHIATLNAIFDKLVPKQTPSHEVLNLIRTKLDSTENDEKARKEILSDIATIEKEVKALQAIPVTKAALNPDTSPLIADLGLISAFTEQFFYAYNNPSGGKDSKPCFLKFGKWEFSLNQLESSDLIQFWEQRKWVVLALNKISEYATANLNNLNTSVTNGKFVVAVKPQEAASAKK